MRSSPSIDRLLVDIEHGNVSDDSTHEMGIAHCVRCGGDTVPDKRALASDAHGTLVPARVIARDGYGVSYLKFPRKEGYVCGGYVCAAGSDGVKRLSGREYLSRRMKGLLLQCRLRRRGVGGVDEIAAIDGVDVFLGRSIWRLRLRIEFGMSMTRRLWCNSTGYGLGGQREEWEKGRREGGWDILRHGGAGQGWARNGSRWLVRCRT